MLQHMNCENHVVLKDDKLRNRSTCFYSSKIDKFLFQIFRSILKSNVI